MDGRRLIGLVMLFDVIALSILYPHIDIFSCGYLVLSTALSILAAVVSRYFQSPDEIQRLFYSKDIDRTWDRCVVALGLAELGVFFEYSHWRPIPGLLATSVQIVGLSLTIAGTIWLVWVDSYLVREFPSHFQRGALMTSGPYRHVRHPLYIGLLATRLSLPLIFGSAIACVLAIAWYLLIRRRARLEERYLSGRFGAVYSQYAAHALGIP
jgi:protein-S-isoprenylcysteine O-methyltransferase Ste14